MADKTKLILQLQADKERLQKDLNKAKGSLKTFEGKAGRIAKQIQGTLAATFAVGTIVSFGKAVIDTTAEFQKMEAVLTNTLGSNSAAKQAMDDIVDFASKTPFQVDQLTGAFVKLSNQGFKPSNNELRKLGDLAASTGKDFDQLAEAIIDAQVGEFERLKEFGIRASKQGDRVTFTFKGVQTQTEFTEKAIRDYLLTLGDAKGVSGAMAAISETLGGKLSNLDDNFTQLKKNIGELVAGPLSDILDDFNSFFSLLNSDAANGFEKFMASFASPWIVDLFNVYENVAEKTKELNEQKKLLNMLSGDTEKLHALAEEIRKRKEMAAAVREEAKALEELKMKTFEALKAASSTDSLESAGILSGLQIPDDFGLRFIEEVKPHYKYISDELLRLNQELNEVIQSSISSAIAGIAEGLGTGGIGEAFQNLADVLGDGMQSIGRLMIAYGVALLLLKKSLMELNPYAAIAAGSALVAAGAAIKNTSGGLGDRIGGSGGGGSSSSGPSGSFQNNFQNQSAQTVTFRVQGADLIAALDEGNRLRGRGAA